MPCVPIRRALLSVSDKLGLIGFAQALRQAGVELVSTGGTRRHLAEGGVESRDLATITGWPEMMDGRVKTLHPAVFGGILFRRDHADDRAALERHQLLPFDLVVVNLYPFAATARRPGVGEDELIEQIDIGGPSLVRAAAKNSAFVTVATSPRHYGEILDQVQNQGGTSAALRRRLMIEAFQHTAAYDQAIADHWSGAFAQRPVSGAPHPAGETPLPAPLRREQPPGGSPLPPRWPAHGEHRPRAATARQGTFVQQHSRSRCRAGHRPHARRARLRRGEAQQSLRRRDPANARASRRGRLRRRPAERIRLRRRVQPHGRRSDRRRTRQRRSIRRSDRRPRLHRRRGRCPDDAPQMEEERPPPAGRPPAR